MSQTKFGDTLVKQASVERIHNDEMRRHKDEESLQVIKEISDEYLQSIWPSDTENVAQSFSVILASDENGIKFLQSVLATCDRNEIWIKHVETRPEMTECKAQAKAYDCSGATTDTAVRFEIFLECFCSKAEFIATARSLCENHQVKRLSIHKNEINTALLVDEVPWFPKHVSELDNCSHCLTKYDPTSDPRHPGFGDNAYVERRAKLNAIALAYKYGDALPQMEYLESEHRTWRSVFEKLKSLHASHSSAEYLQSFTQMENEGLFQPDSVPKMARLSEYLHRKTGFTLRPCGGLLSARDFLASLAFRVFQTSIYVRHHKSPQHSPEPDLIHEFLGHCPMFADPMIAQFSQEIGLLSLGATDEQIEQLATLYWFFIEFGLCRENGQLKAIGAGLLSSYGELMHACSDKPMHKEFDPKTTALQKYEDSDYQPIYFVSHSISNALLKLRSYISDFKRPFSTIYDPYTKTVKIAKHACDLAMGLERLEHEISAMRVVAQSVD